MNAGEREYPSEPGSINGIDGQHIQRYEWARQFCEGKRVYDIACGCGYGSQILDAKKYTGIDLSDEAIAFAKANYYDPFGGVDFYPLDAQNLPDLRKRDVIVSFETIEHLVNPDAFLNWAFDHADMLVISSPIKGSCGQSPFHVTEYSIEGFKAMLECQWNHVEYWLQDGLTITDLLPDSKGNILAVCYA